MNTIKNPFSPGAGSPPPELVGREGILEQARVLLGRVKERRTEKSVQASLPLRLVPYCFILQCTDRPLQTSRTPGRAGGIQRPAPAGRGKTHQRAAVVGGGFVGLTGATAL